MQDQPSALTEYIRQQREAGFDTATIRATLIAHSWDARLVDDAFGINAAAVPIPTGSSVNYSDRVNRLGFFLAWLYLLATLAVPMLLGSLITVFFKDSYFLGAEFLHIAATISAVVFLVLLFPVWFLNSRRRLHDMGYEWYLMLLILTPIFGIAFFFWLLFAPGQDANKYGPPNKDYRFWTLLGFRKSRLS